MDLAQLLSGKAVDGLDIQKGIALYDGRISVYMEVLHAFYEQGPRQLTVMQEALKEHDFVRYGIETHALKSAAYGVGATMLGDLAAESYAAGKSGDPGAVQRKSGRLLRKYRSMIDALTISGLMKEENAESAGPISTEDLRLRLTEAADMAGGYDLSAADGVLRALLRHTLARPTESRIQAIQKMAVLLQYEETEEALRKLIAELE